MSQDANNNPKTDQNQIDTSGFTFSFPAQFPTEVNQSNNNNSGFTFTFPDANGDDANGFNFSNPFFQNSNNTASTDAKPEESTQINSEQNSQQTSNTNVNDSNNSANSSFNPFENNTPVQNSNDIKSENSESNVKPQDNDQQKEEQSPQQNVADNESSPPSQFNPFTSFLPQSSSNSTNEDKKTEHKEAVKENHSEQENKETENQPKLAHENSNNNNSSASDLDLFFNNTKDQPWKQPATINAFDINFDIPQTSQNNLSTGAIPDSKTDFDSFFGSITSPTTKPDENNTSTKKIVDDLFADFKSPNQPKQTENSDNNTSPPINNENTENKNDNNQTNINDGFSNAFGDFPSHLTIPKKEEPASFGGFADPSTQPKVEKKDDDLFATFSSGFNDKSNNSEAKSFSGFAFADSAAPTEATKESDNKDQEAENKENENKSNNNAFEINPAALSKTQNKPEAATNEDLGGFSFTEKADEASEKEEDQKDMNGNDLFASFPAALAKTQSKKDGDSVELGGFSFTDSQKVDENEVTQEEDKKDDNNNNSSAFASFPAALAKGSTKPSTESTLGGFTDSAKQTEKSDEDGSEGGKDVFASFPAALAKGQSKDEAESKEPASTGGLGGFSFADSATGASDQAAPASADGFGGFTFSDSAVTGGLGGFSFTDAPKTDKADKEETGNDSKKEEEEKKEGNDAFASFPAALAKGQSKDEADSKESAQAGGFTFSDSAATGGLGGFSFTDAPKTAEAVNEKEAAENDSKKEEEEKKEGNDAFASFPAALAKGQSKGEADSKESAQAGGLSGFSFTDAPSAKPPPVPASNDGFTFSDTTAVTGGFSFTDASTKPDPSEQPSSTANESNSNANEGDTNSASVNQKVPSNDDQKVPEPSAESGGFTFNFTPSFGASKEGEDETKPSEDSKSTTEPNFADFSGFSFTAAENAGGFTFNFPNNNNENENETAADGEAGDKPISFGSFNPFGGGFTFTPATPESAQISKEADAETTEKKSEEEARPKRKIRGSTAGSAALPPFGRSKDKSAAAEDEIESYKGVALGDTSYEALQNLLLNPIFKQERIDFKEYYDKQDETDSIDGALEFLRAHASK